MYVFTTLLLIFGLMLKLKFGESIVCSSKYSEYLKERLIIEYYESNFFIKVGKTYIKPLLSVIFFVLKIRLIVI